MPRENLSRSINRQARNYIRSSGLDRREYAMVQGIKIDFPYSEVETMSYDDFVPPGVYESYETMSELFDPQKMSPKWINFIKEVGKARKQNGSRGPVNLGAGILFLSEESTLAQKCGVPKLGRTKEGDINFRDGKKIKKMIDMVLDNPQLRQEYKTLLTRLIPDVSNDWLDKDEVRKVLEKSGIRGGIMLDLGCGTGCETSTWSQKMEMFTIGVERQYHRNWYDPNWKDESRKQKNLSFTRGDFKRGLPFKDESADAAVFQFVAQHVTEESIESGVQEALRVLKDGGWMFVGPQSGRGNSGWRFFRKEKGNGGQDAKFKEYKYYDIVPEDKPKPFRWGRKR